MKPEINKTPLVKLFFLRSTCNCVALISSYSISNRMTRSEEDMNYQKKKKKQFSRCF